MHAELSSSFDVRLYPLFPVVIDFRRILESLDSLLYNFAIFVCDGRYCHRLLFILSRCGLGNCMPKSFGLQECTNSELPFMPICTIEFFNGFIVLSTNLSFWLFISHKL